MLNNEHEEHYRKKYEIHKTDKKTLYHYTNAESLRKILSEKIFYVTMSEFLNDSTEIVYMQKIIDDVCKDERNFDETFVNSLSDVISIAKHILPDVFILSLSENPDSLALWSNYSNHDGYNLGIDCRMLEATLRNTGFLYEHGKIIYERKTQEELVYNELNSVYRTLLKVHKGFNYWDVLAKRLMVYSIFFKDPSFIQEEEYRIVFFVNKSNYVELMDTGIDSRSIKFRVRNGVFVPYIEVPFICRAGIDTGKIPLSAITIGPKQNDDTAEKGLIYFLNSLGHPFPEKRISKSKIPLRF